MSASALRLLAIILMTIDHVGSFIFPQFIILRLIGRLSFPLFAWLIANGAIHTHSPKKYLLRLGALALISQLPFYLAQTQKNPDFIGLNIFFTLTLGLLAILISTSKLSRLFKIFIIFSLCILGELAAIDYGAFGILSVLIFHQTYTAPKKMLIFQLLLWSMESMYIFVSSYGLQISLNLLSVLAIVIIRQYNQKPGLQLKKFFYSFYPFHLTLIYILNRFFLA